MKFVATTKPIFAALTAVLLIGCENQSTLNSFLLSDAKRAVENKFREKTEKVDVKNLAIIGEREGVCGELHIKTDPDLGYKPFTYIPSKDKPITGGIILLDRYNEESLDLWCKGWRPETPAEVLAAQEAVKLKLKDPASAQFRNVKSKGYSVCGEVNAKNGFGGYTGYTRFTYLPSRGDATLEDEVKGTSLSKTVFELTCK